MGSGWLPREQLPQGYSFDCAPRNQPLARPSLKKSRSRRSSRPSTHTVGLTAAQAVSRRRNANTLRESQSAADEFAPANARSAAEAMKPSQPLEYQARVSPPKSLADKESGLRKDAGRDSSR